MVFLKFDNGTLINASNIESIERCGEKGIQINMVSGKSYRVSCYEYPTDLIYHLDDISDGKIRWDYI